MKLFRPILGVMQRDVETTAFKQLVRREPV